MEPPPRPGPVRRFGRVLIAAGFLVPFCLLGAGGFLGPRATGATTNLFAAAYLIGVIFPGLPLRAWVRSSRRIQAAKVETNPNRPPGVWLTIAFFAAQGVIIWVFFGLFESKFFRTPQGQQAFLIGTGVVSASLLLLGSGLASPPTPDDLDGQNMP
jgi:hypothetical protein